MSDSGWITDLLRSSLSGSLSPAGAKPGGSNSGERRVYCSECQTHLLEKDRAANMIAVHGYLAVSGASLPLPTALACLWERVFNTGDAESHERLRRLLTGLGNGPDGRTAYAVGLEKELLNRLRSKFFASKRRVALLIQNLRQANRDHQDFWPLVKAEGVHVRRLGREIVLPDVAAELSDPHTASNAVRTQIEKLCPIDDIWEKVQVCRRLPNLGAWRPACKQCLSELRAERPVACPECSTPVPGSQLDAHLRQVHHIYQFRGVRRSQYETIALLLRAVCDSKPDE